MVLTYLNLVDLLRLRQDLSKKEMDKWKMRMFRRIYQPPFVDSIPIPLEEISPDDVEMDRDTFAPQKVLWFRFKIHHHSYEKHYHFYVTYLESGFRQITKALVNQNVPEDDLIAINKHRRRWAVPYDKFDKHTHNMCVYTHVFWIDHFI